VRSGALSSAHDVAEGGVAVALAESALAGRLGAQVTLGEGHWESLGPEGGVPDPGWPEGSAAAALFGEGSGGIIVSGPEAGLRALAGRTHVRLIGRVGGGTAAEGGGHLQISLDGHAVIDAAVEELGSVHAEGLAGFFA
jgi:phosphoribosylformylglycinamidine synthase